MIKPREQLNISLVGESTLAQKLHEAAASTGQARAQIARSVLNTFLETWLRAEETRQQTLADAKGSASGTQGGKIVVHDIGHVQLPHRAGRYQPEPDYWKAVAARRPMPLRTAGQLTNVPVRDVGRPPGRPLQIAPVPDDDIKQDDDWRNYPGRLGFGE